MFVSEKDGQGAAERRRGVRTEQCCLILIDPKRNNSSFKERGGKLMSVKCTPKCKQTDKMDY